MPTKKLILVLASLLGAGLLLALAIALASDEIALRARYDLQSRLKRFASVATLTVDPVGEIKMFLNPNDRVITRQLMAFESWELKETLWFTKSIEAGDTVLDVGANVGYYTLIAGKLVGDEGRVFAFEPDPESFALLERNVRLNGLSNVVLEQKAVSNQEGSIRLYLAEENKGDHRIYAPQDEERDFVEVEAVVLDNYFADDPGTIDFVKVDTQGAEFAILEGMKGLLGANHDILLAVEFWPDGLHEFGTGAEEMLSLLAMLDFRFFILAGPPRSPLREIESDRLLRAYPLGSQRHTNLFLVKGRAEIEELRTKIERWEAKDEAQRTVGQRELDRARNRWRALQPSSPDFPRRSWE